MSLFEAIEKGNFSSVSKLLTKTTIESKNQQGFTPLALAVKAGHLHIATHLLNRGADIEATNYVTFT